MQMHHHWRQTAQKIERGHFEQKAKNQCNFYQSDIRVVYIASSESCKPKIFVQCWNKVERKYIQEQKSNKFPCYNQSMGFVNRMDQNMGMYRIRIQ